MSDSLGSLSINNSDLTQYSQSSPFLTPMQPPQPLNHDANHHFHSTPAPLQHSNFSFHESYLGHPIPCPSNSSQILDPKTPQCHNGYTQSSTSSTNSSDQAWLEHYEATALATSTGTLKRSLNFTAKTLIEPGKKLPRQEWSEKVGPQIQKTVREIAVAYDTCGALTFQQQLTLFHGIVTYLYMYVEPVTVMAKSILAMTVHAVAQVVSQLDELSQDTMYELSVEPSLGNCCIFWQT